ncbi:BTB And Kelch [Ancylostoma duodenale]|uniref:BTB And Kelch n=1 Tax=Ancylostoma duodenale TaxID=51022 RepID=A0A0C2G3S6_9BILA|nr:BTB And Kelch [Ancylostoma duodenale]
MDYSAFSSLISYAYGCSLTVTRENVQAVMMTANYLELQGVTEICATFICEHLLDVENALVLRTIFSSIGSKSAAEDVDRFVEKNFALVSHSDKFLDLSIEDLVELLSKDELHVGSEEDVFNAAMRWIEHAPERVNLLER